MKNPIDIYKNMSAPKKVSFWHTFNGFAQKAMAIITVPIFTRLLTTEQYGMLSVYLSLHGVITIFATLQVTGNSFNNGMIKYGDNRENFTSAMLGISTTLTFAVFVVYIIFADFWYKLFNLPKIAMLFMFLHILFLTPQVLWQVRKHFDFKYQILKNVTLINTFLPVILALVAVFVVKPENRGLARVIPMSVSAILMGLPFIFVLLKKSKSLYNKEYWRFALKYNLPLIPFFLSSVILNVFDRIMIDHMAGRDKTALYSVAYSIAMLMNILVASINASFVPLTYQKTKSGRPEDYASIKKNANLILLLIGGLTMILAAFAPEAVAILAPPIYNEAIWIVPPVTAGVFFICLSGFFANVELYYEKTKYVSVASVICAVMNIVLNFIFIPIFGYMAAGYTTLFSYIIFTILHFLFMQKVCKQKLDGNLIYSTKFMLLLSAAVLAGSAVISATYKLIILRYSIILVIGIIGFVKRKVWLGLIFKKPVKQGE